MAKLSQRELAQHVQRAGLFYPEDQKEFRDTHEVIFEKKGENNIIQIIPAAENQEKLVQHTAKYSQWPQSVHFVFLPILPLEQFYESQIIFISVLMRRNRNIGQEQLAHSGAAHQVREPGVMRTVTLVLASPVFKFQVSIGLGFSVCSSVKGA